MPPDPITPPANDALPQGDPPAPKVETPPEGAVGIPPTPPPDLEAIRKNADEYEKAKPTLEAYGKFEEVLEKDKEVAEAIENAIKGIVDKRKSAAAGGQSNPPAVIPPTGGNDGAPTTTDIRNEIRMKDYMGEFVRVAQAAGVTTEMAQEAFEGTVSELLKQEKDPLINFNLGLVEKSFKSWNDRMDKLVKAKNDIYSKTKASDSVPAQGSGSAPREGEKELLNVNDRRAFIEQGLRAAAIH